MAFWGALSSLDSNSELGKFVYCLINLGLIAVSLLLRRRTFIVFGSIGVFGYLGHLAYSVFQDSFAFPFVLSGLGLGIIYLGVQYRRKKEALEGWISARILPVAGPWIPPPPTSDD